MAAEAERAAGAGPGDAAEAGRVAAGSGGLRGRLRALWGLLLREHTQPGRVAAAVLLGCVVGCTPLFGLHLPLCLVLALLLRLNKLVVYGAANISIPPLVPFLGLASVQLGELALRGRPLWLTAADFRGAALRQTAGRFFSAWLVGGALLGLLIGGAAALVVYLALRRRDASAEDPVDAALQRATARYQGLHPRYAIYARMKYRMDPCYRAIAARVAPGASVVDLGTGLGMLPLLLGELGQGRAALGIEWDAGKAEAGQRAALGLLGVHIQQGDLRAAALPACDVVTLVDVLHYYDPAGQRETLARAAAALQPGGLLLVREGDGARRGGARWTRLVERAMVRLGWNRGPGVRFRPLAELVADLRALGLSVEWDDTAGRLHPGNVLLQARKAAATGALA